MPFRPTPAQVRSTAHSLDGIQPQDAAEILRRRRYLSKLPAPRNRTLWDALLSAISEASSYNTDVMAQVEQAAGLASTPPPAPLLAPFFKRAIATGHYDVPTIGTIGELFPALARTRSGTDISATQLAATPSRWGTGYVGHPKTTSLSLPSDGRIALGPPLGADDFERGAMPPAQELANALIHEAKHAEQDLRTALPLARSSDLSTHDYYAHPIEREARRAEWSTHKLLQNKPGPLFALAAIPGLLDRLSQWSKQPNPSGLLEPTRGFISGLSPTGSIPSSSDLSTFGKRTVDLWSNPSPQALGEVWDQAAGGAASMLGGLADMASNPLPTLGALLHQARQNPAGTAGQLAAMMMPLPGGRKLARGTPEDFLRAANEDARIKQFNLEGYEGRAESATINPWTREERGAEELRKLGIEPPLETTHGVDNQLISRSQPDAWDALRARIRGEEVPGPGPKTFHYDRADIPADVSFLLKREFPDAPLGQTMWRNGERWVNTRKGWTRDLDSAPAIKGPHVNTELMSQAARVIHEKGAAWGVEELIKHGGLETSKAAQTVAFLLAGWRRAGAKLTPEQIAWHELYSAGKYKPKP